MGYRIDKIVFVKLSPIHIPYFSYMLIKGPKGGTYLLDEFNSELLLKHISNNIVSSTGNAMSAIGRLMGNLDYTITPINDKTIRTVAKGLNAWLLQRLGCVSKTKVIADKLDADQYNIIKQTLYKLYTREIR